MARTVRRLVVAAVAAAGALVSLVALAGPAMAQSGKPPSVPLATATSTSRPSGGPSSECLVAEALRGASTSTTFGFGRSGSPDCTLPGQDAARIVDQIPADLLGPPPTTRSTWEVVAIVLRLASLTIVAISGFTVGITRWRRKRAGTVDA